MASDKKISQLFNNQLLIVQLAASLHINSVIKKKTFHLCNNSQFISKIEHNCTRLICFVLKKKTQSSFEDLLIAI